MAARRTTKLAAGATVAPKLAGATAHLAARAAKLAAITSGLA